MRVRSPPARSSKEIHVIPPLYPFSFGVYLVAGQSGTPLRDGHLIRCVSSSGYVMAPRSAGWGGNDSRSCLLVATCCARLRRHAPSSPTISRVAVPRRGVALRIWQQYTTQRRAADILEVIASIGMQKPNSAVTRVAAASCTPSAPKSERWRARVPRRGRRPDSECRYDAPK